MAKVLVAALKFAEDHGSLWSPGSDGPDCFEVGPKNDTATVLGIANMVVDLSGSKSEITSRPMRPGEVEGATVRADLRSLELLKEYGVDPDDFIPLVEGVQETINWYRDEY